MWYVARRRFCLFNLERKTLVPVLKFVITLLRGGLSSSPLGPIFQTTGSLSSGSTKQLMTAIWAHFASDGLVRYLFAVAPWFYRIWKANLKVLQKPEDFLNHNCNSVLKSGTHFWLRLTWSCPQVCGGSVECSHPNTWCPTFLSVSLTGTTCSGKWYSRPIGLWCKNR